MSTDKKVPTLYEWAGGEETFKRLTSTFYGKVIHDPLLQPLFGTMAQDHPQRVAWCLGEVFGGPKTYTEQRGGHLHLIQHHLNRHLSEQQRARWVSLLMETADEIGMPSDPEFRAAFVSYIEWGWLWSMQVGLKPAFDCIKAFSETDQTEDLKKFDVPTLLIHGDDDQIVPIHDSALLAAKLIKDATLKVYPGASHGLMSTHKEKFNEDLLAFIRS